MHKLLEYLENYNPVPTYSQIAIGRNWEDAVRIEFDETIDYSNLLKKLDDPTLAFEIFYKLNDGRNVFMGLRFSPQMKNISTPEEFLHIFGEVLKLAPTSSIKTIFSKLGNALESDPNAYLKSEPSYVEIGVVDFWKSLGSIVLRKQGDPTLSEDSLRKLLSQNEVLLRNSKNYMTLDFAFDNPQHWIAIQASTAKDNEHVMDFDRLTKLVDML